jgi:hypothetical protein
MVDDPEWIQDKLIEYQNFYPEDQAERMLEDDKNNLRGKITQYKTKSGKILISGSATDVNRVAVPVLREHAAEVWDASTGDQKAFVKKRYDDKLKEKDYTLAKEGIQIFGENVFITSLAEDSPESYFQEAYTAYVVDPVRLAHLDEPMYDFLRDGFMDREYLLHGGIQ